MCIISVTNLNKRICWELGRIISRFPVSRTKEIPSDQEVIGTSINRKGLQVLVGVNWISMCMWRVVISRISPNYVCMSLSINIS